MSFTALKDSITAAISNERESASAILDHIAKAKDQALAQNDATREFIESTFDNLAEVIRGKILELIGEANSEDVSKVA